MIVCELIQRNEANSNLSLMDKNNAQLALSLQSRIRRVYVTVVYEQSLYNSFFKCIQNMELFKKKIQFLVCSWIMNTSGLVNFARDPMYS